jgi:hypothetical protein
VFILSCLEASSRTRTEYNNRSTDQQMKTPTITVHNHNRLCCASRSCSCSIPQPTAHSWNWNSFLAITKATEQRTALGCSCVCVCVCVWTGCRRWQDTGQAMAFVVVGSCFLLLASCLSFLISSFLCQLAQLRHLRLETRSGSCVTARTRPVARKYSLARASGLQRTLESRIRKYWRAVL